MVSVLEDDIIREYIREKSGDLGLSMCQLIEQGVTIIADLAETMNIPRRATRQVLYQMNKERIIHYKRARLDNRIVFHWYLTPKKIRRMIKTERQKDIRELEERLQFEMDHKFFECIPCNERYLFSEAFDFEFTCEHCGNLLQAHDNEALIEDLREKIDVLVEKEKLSSKDSEEPMEDDEEDLEIADEERKNKDGSKDRDYSGVYYDDKGWPDE